MNTASLGETKFSVGDLIKVYTTIIEEGKSRTQLFEGVVLGIKGRQENKSFLVRKIASSGIGVEKIFPLFSPLITKLEVIKKGKDGTRRAKLYYLRDRGKKSQDRIWLRAGRKGKTSKPKVRSQKKKSAKN